MANIPKAPLEGTSSESSDTVPMISLTENDGAGGLRAVLIGAAHSVVENAQHLGAMRVGGAVAENAAVGGYPVLTGGRYDATNRTLGDGDVGAVALDAAGRIQIAEPGTPGVVAKTLTIADTEYSEALPAYCRAISFQCRTAFDVRFAWVTGKVAGPAEPYQTLKSGEKYKIGNIRSPALTLYLASSEAGVVVEIEAWS